jgi:gliding motility-associated-like protein
MRKSILTISFYLLSLSSFAKHITGGEMIYDFLSSTATTRTFRVTLILFRDENCFNCATMPGTVRIGIYNNDNNEPYGGAGSLPTIDVDLLRTETLPITNVPLCISNQPVLTYTAGYYSFAITLKNNVNGYTAAYQTCCRIDNINNIDNGTTSNGAGATYATTIPGYSNTANINNDNSPRFSKGISIVCNENAFTLDFSATDPDGDQLVYTTCYAYNGGSAVDASNITPSVPPYGSLNYISNFSGVNPLGPQASINAQTGIISGIAPISGKYVVSVCVSSYRNGVYIATHRKDFIITVADCDFASAELNPEYITCDGFNYTFSNLNQSPLNQSFYWDFGDPGSGVNNSSTLPSPTHTYSTAGTFLVKFIVNRGTPCADTAFSTIKVYPGYFPAFSQNSPLCKGNPVRFNDQTTANYGSANSWHWDFGINNIDNDTSNIQNPQYVYNTLGTYTATLIVGSTKGCVDTVQQTVTIVDKPILNVTNDTLMCSRDNMQLNASTSIVGNYIWTPNYNINNSNIPNPVVSPDVDTTYYVNYSDNLGCANRDSVRIRVVDTVTLKTAHDTTICRKDGVILGTSGNALHFVWSPASTLNNPNVGAPVATPTSAFTTYYVTGNIGTCRDFDSIKVKTVPYPAANAGRDTLICWGTPAFLHSSGGSSYVWSPTIYLSNPTIPNPISVNPDAVYIDYIVTVRDTLGCPKPVNDTIRVNIDHIIANAGPRDTAVVMNQPLQLNATGSINYQWTPVTQWLSNPNIANPVSNPQDNIEYVVLVSNNIGCFDTDTINVLFYKVLPGFYIPKAFTPNYDGLNDVLTPIALGMKSVDLFIIYNRWGQLLFKATTIGQGWNGTFKGKVQETGTYVWYAKGKTFENKEIEAKGTVVLLK